MALFDWHKHFDPVLSYLNETGNTRWTTALKEQLTRRFEDNPHGDMARWHNALQSLPDVADARVDLNQSAITLTSPSGLDPDAMTRLENGLRGLMPWRKGPFDFFGTYIDTEWRSDWKWDRVAPHLADLAGRTILDVGCGSGYHCWRMAERGPGR